MNFSPKSWSPAVVVPGIVSLIVIILGVAGVVSGLDHGLYDNYLHVKPAIPESNKLVLLDVDDAAIARLGQWPWPRNVMADALVTAKELGLDSSVFDIEYLEDSPPGVDLHYLKNDLKAKIDGTVGDLRGNMADLFSALQNKQMSLKEATSPVNDLLDRAEEARSDLYGAATKVARNNDLYLAQSLSFIGAGFVTLHRVEEARSGSSEALLGLAKKKFPVTVTGSEERPPRYVSLKVPLEPLVTRSAGAGITDVQIDSDGKRRRIRLLESIGGDWYPQLVFAPLLRMLGNPGLVLSPNTLRLENARYPDGSIQNVDIPLDENGMMLINWSSATFDESFKPHVSLGDLTTLNDAEDSIVRRLTSFSLRDIWLANPTGNLALDVLNAHDALLALRDQALATGKTTDVQAFLEGKAAWRKSVQDLVAPDVQKAVLGAAQEQVDAATGADRELWVQEKTAGETSFHGLVGDATDYLTLWNTLSQQLSGRLAIIGYTGTGTTDIGVNPFHERYINVGTHPALANTILQRQFLSETPGWISLVLVAPLAFGMIFLIRKLKPLQQNLVGFGLVFGLLLAGIVVFLVTGTFIPLAGPLLAMFLSFIAYSLVRFFGSEQEKAFITKAFSTYLSPDVIDQIVADPTKMKLGGVEKEMTAMFTDVKGFSTISEKLTATELVHLLNEYLTGMSDIVLAEKGTIDKFEGDAIIAFFGAPIDLPDHASRACEAALRMRSLEEAMNPGFLERKMTPTPLMTRIGINTGPMVVGNMGTTAKMNYTIMGNAVNLSARLEGVNKQYGTWILTTEMTAGQTGDRFLFRRLDRVRVVGINTPVLLQNLLGVRSELDPRVLAMVERFHLGMDAFEARDWATASRIFSELEAEYPEDGPAKLYSKRSKDFLAKAPAASWDGVFNLTEK